MRDTWPRQDIETGYTEAQATQHAINSHAPFERTLQMVAEVHRRLERTGSDGRELVMLLENGTELSGRAKGALIYCSGWRRRQESYQRWLRYRGKKTNFAGGLDKVPSNMLD